MLIASSNNNNRSNLARKLETIKNDLKEAYFEKPHPWVIAYSGGKDSTLVLQLVCELLLSLPRKQRRKEVHVVANDTLVESPLIIKHLDKSLAALRSFQKQHNLPLKAVKTTPDLNGSFWVNLIGRGYIPPTRTFRWCTPRMKITPTNNYIKKFISKAKEVILLLGVRKSESVNRKRSIERYRNEVGERYNRHSDLKGCLLYRPIVDIDNEEVWHLLMQRKPPWGKSHRNLITLYRNAQGGECPTVLSNDDAPSCGSTSPRFGCWTCTVVNKDKSMGGLIDSGFEEFEPLLEFRNWLIELRENTDNRMPIRRNGKAEFRSNGNRIYGPFLLNVRKAILKKLRELEKETGLPLISKNEIFLIDAIWREDTIFYRTSNQEQYVEKSFPG